MRRVAYQVVIRVALVLGHVQAALATEFRACNRAIHLPWALLVLVLWAPFRLAFVVAFKAARVLATPAVRAAFDGARS